MQFVAIMDDTSDGRLAKYMGFLTEAEADAHVALFLDRYPLAFVIPRPAFPQRHWRIDFAGKTVTNDPLVVVAPVPDSVTKLQLVRAMRTTSIWSAFKSSLKQSSSTVKEDWEYASTIDRGDSLTDAFAVSLSLNPAEMDDLFRTAQSL